MTMNRSKQTGNAAPDINLGSLELSSQLVSSAEYLKSLFSFSISVNKVLPWIGLQQNEVCEQVIALMI